MPLGVALCESVVSQPCKRNREVACLQRQSSTPTGSWLCCVLRGVDKLETVTVDFGTVRVDADCRREAGRVNPKPYGTASGDTSQRFCNSFTVRGAAGVFHLRLGNPRDKNFTS